MNPVEYVKICFRKYIDFSGRAGRPEFWWFVLFWVIAAFATGWIPFLGEIIILLLLLPLLAVGARRLHDTGRTGWWLLLGLVPFVGGIALLVMMALPGTAGPNIYGPGPLQFPARGGYPADPGHPQAPTPDARGASRTAPPPAYTPSGRRYCPQCGAERKAEDGMFCTVCGAAF